MEHVRDRLHILNLEVALLHVQSQISHRDELEDSWPFWLLLLQNVLVVEGEGTANVTLPDVEELEFEIEVFLQVKLLHLGGQLFVTVHQLVVLVADAKTFDERVQLDCVVEPAHKDE